MLKLCAESVCIPLNIILKTCLRTGKIPLEWKKANVVPIHRKDDNQIIKNCCPVSLLPVCGKIFKRLLYDIMFDFYSQNNLLTPKQSEFRPPDDSCINHKFFQLIMKF